MTPHQTMHMYDDFSLRAHVPAAQTARRMLAHGSCVRRLVGDDRAQDLIEYALLLVFIALAVISGLQSLGIAVNGQYGPLPSRSLVQWPQMLMAAMAAGIPATRPPALGASLVTT